MNDHGHGHIEQARFRTLIRDQLATDCDEDPDCMPLYQVGARGALFKVRLSSHGYTLVAKGVEPLDLAHLQHESGIYDRLQPIQGIHVPVCLGGVDLDPPYYYDCGIFVHFLFLSWAGNSLPHSVELQVKDSIVAAVGTAFDAIHALGIVHGDAEPRNMLYDASGAKVTVVDFERSRLRVITGDDDNDERGKTKREFAKEARSAVERVRQTVQVAPVIDRVGQQPSLDHARWLSPTKRLKQTV